MSGGGVGGTSHLQARMDNPGLLAVLVVREPELVVDHHLAKRDSRRLTDQFLVDKGP